MAKCFLPTSASSLSHSRKPPSGVPLKYLCHVELLWSGLMPLMHPRWTDGLERKRSGYNEGLKAEACFYRWNSHKIKMLLRCMCVLQTTSVKTSGMPAQKSNRRKSLLHIWPGLLTNCLTSFTYQWAMDSAYWPQSWLDWSWTLSQDVGDHSG